MAGPLPEFDNPPVSEVVLSIEFAPLENWRGPYAGLYWGTIKEEYPDTEVHPALPSQIEKFGDEAWQQHGSDSLSKACDDLRDP